MTVNKKPKWTIEQIIALSKFLKEDETLIVKEHKNSIVTEIELKRKERRYKNG